MLCELTDELLHIIETCGPCSGNVPSDVAYPGAAGSAGDAGAGNPSPDEDEWEPEPGRKKRWYDGSDSSEPSNPPEYDDPDYDDPDYERKLRRRNREKAQEGALTKLLQWNWNYTGKTGVGKLTGQLGTVASGVEVLVDGATTVTEAERKRDQNIHEGSGGAFPPPPPRGQGRNSQPKQLPSESEQPVESPLEPHKQESVQRAEDLIKEIRERERRREDQRRAQERVDDYYRRRRY